MHEGNVQAPWTASRYAVVDVEGNGQQPPDLVELAVVPIVEGTIGAPLTWLVKPPRPITAMARRFHKISDGQVASAPAVAEVADDMRAALEGVAIVAHNAHVDLDVLGRELRGFRPVHVIDTLKLARRRLPGQDSYRLGALAGSLALTGGLPEGLVPHRAAYDALVCARLLTHLASPPDSAPLTLADLLTGVGKTAKAGDSDESAPPLF